MDKKKLSGIIAEIATVLFLLLNGLDIQFKHNARQWVREDQRPGRAACQETPYPE